MKCVQDPSSHLQHIKKLKNNSITLPVPKMYPCNFQPFIHIHFHFWWLAFCCFTKPSLWLGHSSENIWIYAHHPQILETSNRQCYLECRDHLCSFQIPGWDLHRTCPRFLGVELCTHGYEDVHTLGCRLTIHSTLPSCRPLQRKILEATVSRNQQLLGNFPHTLNRPPTQ